ncbi:PREDICTED: G-protein coupled receptor 54-like [Branchiostoma belcheri]|uniref:G-protein coupled receptor 54-like n=1 Tax=Branchiostoma belcheri TaxID=7741 RepID=A0A6P4ZYV5_BRABE|nr:PREDICTED: G-protein coupled receptor 54-like [Branchiostoma belcheri]KAI8516119.1 receptor [Branchiostoma belcheri]
MDNLTEDFIGNTSRAGNQTDDGLGAVAYVMPSVCGVILLIGGVGNSLVIYIVARFSEMRTVTNYYIVNLAVTDLAFLVCCIPFTSINYLTYRWIFGSTMCTIVFYMIQVTVQSTCITLAVLSIDRYCAIVHPLRSINFRTRKVAAITSGCTWIGSFLLALPLGMSLQVQEVENYNFGRQEMCLENWPTQSARRSYMVYTFLITYVIPLVFCTISCSFIVQSILNRFSASHAQKADAHARQARRTSCMVVGVVVLFAFCWLPNHIMNVWAVFHTDSHMKHISETTKWLKTVALILCYSNSAVNPFVYTLLGENYRRCIKLSFPCLFKQPPPNHAISFKRSACTGATIGKSQARRLHGNSSTARPIVVTFNAKDTSTKVTMSYCDSEEQA